jgi:transposase InsO family protein
MHAAPSPPAGEIERAIHHLATLGIEGPEAVMSDNAFAYRKSRAFRWAYAHSWPDSTERTRALPSFLRYYNRRRPHGSPGDRPPISRVHNVRGQDS